MNRLLGIFAIVLLLSGCAAGIKRYGYDLKLLEGAESMPRQPVAIQFQADYGEDEVEVLGRIRSYETGFAVKCDEGYVLDIFCTEARALGADVVNIVSEKHPNFWVTCYRAEAEFLRFNDRAKAQGLESDPQYAPELVAKRSKKTKDTMRASTAMSIVTGAVVGIMAARN